MATGDRKMNAFAQVTDVEFVYGELADGSQVKMNKVDIFKENELLGGVPAKIRALDAEGNRISPTTKEIADNMPGERAYEMGMYYSLPKLITTFIRAGAGDATKTLTLFEVSLTDNMHFYFFDIFIIPAFNNNHCLPGLSKINYSPSGGILHNVLHISQGAMSNLRRIRYNGKEYFAIDVLVSQYGSCKIGLTGFHEDISQMMDVTENFTEI